MEYKLDIVEIVFNPDPVKFVGWSYSSLKITTWKYDYSCDDYFCVQNTGPEKMEIIFSNWKIFKAYINSFHDGDKETKSFVFWGHLMKHTMNSLFKKGFKHA